MPSKALQLMGAMGPMDLAQSDTIGGDATLKGLASKYPIYLNGYFETTSDRQDVDRQVTYNKRFGVGTIIKDTSATYNGYHIQGITTSLDKTKTLFYMNNGSVNRTAYYDGTTLTVSAGNAPAAAGNWTFTGPVAWTILDGISYGANVFYAVTDFVKGAVVDAGGTWTEITDADFTGLNKATNMVGLDGYLFIGTTDNRIYNSDLNVSSSWAATSFLTAGDTPGALKWLGRIKNYLLAFKQYSLEFFEDTGNPTPGSPLSPVKALRKHVGLVTPSSIQYVSDGIIFMGISEKTRIGIYKIYYDDLHLELVSDLLVNTFLGMVSTYTTPSSSAYSVDSTVSGTYVGQSQVCTWAGKEWYIINLNNGGGRTLVYDNILKVWVFWATAFTGAIGDAIFVPSQCIQMCIGTFTYQVFVNNYTNAGSRPYLVAAQETYALSCADINLSGSNNTFPWLYVGDTFDFGTRQRKFMDSLEFLYETSTGAATNITVTLYYRDSGLTTVSSGNAVTRTKTFSIGDHQGRARFTRLGSFRARQIGVMEESFTRFKLCGIQTQFNVGEQDQDS